jgi:hypothetical protein
LTIDNWPKYAEKTGRKTQEKWRKNQEKTARNPKKWVESSETTAERFEIDRSIQPGPAFDNN